MATMVWSKTHGITIASVSEWFQHLALKPTLNPSNDPCAPRLRWPKRRFAKFITTVAKSSQREETHARTLKLPNQNNPRAGCSIMGGWTPGAWTIPGSYSWRISLPWRSSWRWCWQAFVLDRLPVVHRWGMLKVSFSTLHYSGDL